MAETLNGQRPAYFLLSFDTELAWGHFDCFRPELFSADGRRERHYLGRVLDLLDEYEVAATWAVVGKLFDPSYPAEWRGRYPAFEQLHAGGSGLLHGADFLETLLRRAARHEIAFHGHTHTPFAEDTMTAAAARSEIEAWIQAAAKWGVGPPRTVIFPRNRIGHRDVFAQAGFICCRGEQVNPRTHSLPLVGRAFRRYSEYLALASAPQTYALPAASEGALVNLPASRWLFGMSPGFERRVERSILQRLRIGRLVAGIRAAASRGEVVHLWAHPYEFRTDEDIELLDAVLQAAQREIRLGRMKSSTMVDLASRLTVRVAA